MGRTPVSCRLLPLPATKRIRSGASVCVEAVPSPLLGSCREEDTLTPRTLRYAKMGMARPERICPTVAPCEGWISHCELLIIYTFSFLPFRECRGFRPPSSFSLWKNVRLLCDCEVFCFRSGVPLQPKESMHGLAGEHVTDRRQL